MKTWTTLQRCTLHIYTLLLVKIQCTLPLKLTGLLFSSRLLSTNRVLGQRRRRDYRSRADRVPKSHPSTSGPWDPLTFLKRRHLPGNSVLHLFSSVGKQTRDRASYFEIRRELFKTLKWMPGAMLDNLIAPHQLCCVHKVTKASNSSHITLLLRVVSFPV